MEVKREAVVPEPDCPVCGEMQHTEPEVQSVGDEEPAAG
jgi:hypothetical protein